MNIIESGKIGIAQGNTILFSHVDENGPMWHEDGDREVRETITFETPFEEPPVVQVSLTMWDADGSRNQRMDLFSENVTRKAFDVVFRCWDDSRVARIRVDWLAFGAPGALPKPAKVDPKASAAGKAADKAAVKAGDDKAKPAAAEKAAGLRPTTVRKTSR